MTGGCGRWIALTASCVLLAAACSSEPSIRLLVPGEGTGHETHPDTKQGEPYSFGAVMLCISAAGSIEITKVTPVGAVGGIRVTEFATRPNPSVEGKPLSVSDPHQSLEQAGLDTSKQVMVSTACPASIDDADSAKHLTEFLMQLERPTEATASLEAVELDYTDGDRVGRLRGPLGVTLCAPDDSTTEHC